METPLPSTRRPSIIATVYPFVLVLLGGLSALLIGSGLAAQDANLKGFGSVVALVYALVLIAWLANTRPAVGQRPIFSPLVRGNMSFRATLWLIILLSALAFLLAAIRMGNGWLMFSYSLVPALAVLAILRARISKRVLITGALAFLSLFLVELIFQPDLVKAAWPCLFLAPQVMAGILLLEHTGLTRFHLADRHFARAWRSFAWGCLLAVPPALLNIASMTAANLTSADRRLDQWWKPIAALQPGILEEGWARLFLLTLCYALLRPTAAHKENSPLVAALLISTAIHGLAHYPQSITSPVSAILIALLYGIPLGLLYIKRDLESAVAYHFWIDFIRFAYTFFLLAAA